MRFRLLFVPCPHILCASNRVRTRREGEIANMGYSEP